MASPRVSESLALALAGLLGLCLFVYAQVVAKDLSRNQTDSSMRFVMPRMMQLMMTGGDRYLAANLATIRALVAPVEGMGPDQYTIQARVQEDAAVLNPAHQDNYFVAAASLPWNGQLDAAQFVLRRAIEARPFDIWPPYQYAFHEWHFRKNPKEAAKWLYVAAERSADFNVHFGMKDLAARWMTTSENLDEAIQVVKAMAASSNDKGFRRYLEKRAARLDALRTLRNAVAEYHEKQGKLPRDLNELVANRILQVLPVDPYGVGFAVTPDGQVVLKTVLARLANKKPQ